MSRRILSFVPASALAALALVATTGSLVGCVQYPTSRQGVVDLRPSLSFTLGTVDAAHLEARVSIDGIDAGRAGDFVEGAGALRVLPGNHVVRVIAGGTSLLDERVYLADGVHRALALP